MISNATACKTLGVSIGATQQDIKDAWRRLMKQYHPDQNGGDNKFEARCKQINEAYQYLSKGAKIRSPESKPEPPKTADGPQTYKTYDSHTTYTYDPIKPQSWQEESLKKTRARTAEYAAEQQKQKDRVKEKHDKFIRLSKARLEQVREEFRKFSNLGNAGNYAYTKEEVDWLFGEITDILYQCREQFCVFHPDRYFDNL